jgi:hypothetical protein
MSHLCISILCDVCKHPLEGDDDCPLHFESNQQAREAAEGYLWTLLADGHAICNRDDAEHQAAMDALLPPPPRIECDGQEALHFTDESPSRASHAPAAEVPAGAAHGGATDPAGPTTLPAGQPPTLATPADATQTSDPAAPAEEPHDDCRMRVLADTARKLRRTPREHRDWRAAIAIARLLEDKIRTAPAEELVLTAGHLRATGHPDALPGQRVTAEIHIAPGTHHCPGGCAIRFC